MNAQDKRRMIIDLKLCRAFLSAQQFRTLKGQILAGQYETAQKGLKRIIDKTLKEGLNNGN